MPVASQQRVAPGGAPAPSAEIAILWLTAGAEAAGFDWDAALGNIQSCARAYRRSGFRRGRGPG